MWLQTNVKLHHYTVSHSVTYVVFVFPTTCMSCNQYPVLSHWLNGTHLFCFVVFCCFFQITASPLKIVAQTYFRITSPAHLAPLIMPLPDLQVLWLHFPPSTWSLQWGGRCCCWLWASAGGWSTTTSMTTRWWRWRRTGIWCSSPPNMAPCGLCRRKCRSRMFPSSWWAPASGSLTPSSRPPVRAAASSRTPTGGETLRFDLLSLSLCAPWCVQGPVTAQQTSGPSLWVCVYVCVCPQVLWIHVRRR